MPFKVLFRADASPIIGGGHIYRCLTLADQLSAIGIDVSFACSHETLRFVSKLQKTNYKIYPLDPLCDLPYDVVDGVQSFDLLVLDHYDWELENEKNAVKFIPKLMKIDDLPEKKTIADVVLNQNLGIEKEDYSGLVKPSARLLMGPTFALLRPVFYETRKKIIHSRQIQKNVNDIVISPGLSDAADMTSIVLETLFEIGYNGKIQITIGRDSPNIEKIKETIKNEKNIHLHVNCEYMEELYAKADLCVGAAGSSSWERCSLGLPTVSVIVAKNQEKIAHFLAEKNISPFVRLDKSTKKLNVMLEKLFLDTNLRKQYSDNSLNACEGNGCMLVVEVIRSMLTAE
ncbi:UDP-2,4-diacetamido-2,4,6-trideoxy-beta-L-altropyranose hydrolase [Curvivirga sp.]|uniref:UDP-2,4-diacetamido-2,4, 6-trideoxy-beta-L-altropyranose hydrolase n=1 Tax=Curvivirga sp. TaxID=2856848 RepID=UPI003B59FED1